MEIVPPLTTWQWVITATFCLAGFLAIYGFAVFKKHAKEEQPAEKAEAEPQAGPVKVKGCALDYPDKLPADRVFTLETLAQWNGITLPMCVGVCGVVVDVSSSENFIPGAGYGKLWAGKDASYALALASLKGEDANTLEWDLEELEEKNRESLLSFYNHFVGKYPAIGTLKEYEHRDFSGFLPEPPRIVGVAGEQSSGADGGKASEKAADKAATESASREA